MTLESKRQEVNQAQEKLENARRKLQDLQSGNSEAHCNLRQKNLEIAQQETEIAQQEQNIQEAQADLENAQRRLENSKILLDKGFISEDTYYNDQESVRSARANLRSQQLSLEQKKLALQQMHLQLEDIQQTIQEKLREAREKVQEAQTTWQKAQVDLRTALLKEEDLAWQRQEILAEQQDYRIQAPFAGVVLDVKTRSEDVVSQGDELVVLGNPNQEVVELKLPIFTASQVAADQEARISKIGPQMDTFSGKIEHIAFLADSNSEDSQSSGRISVTIQLDTPTGELIPGSQVSVEILVKQRQDVVAVPTEAVMAMGSEKAFVWLQNEGGKVQKQSIEMGMEGLTKVEVTEGLQTGDRVVFPTPDMNLEPGMLVQASAGE